MQDHGIDHLGTSSRDPATTPQPPARRPAASVDQLGPDPGPPPLVAHTIRDRRLQSDNAGGCRRQRSARARLAWRPHMPLSAGAAGAREEVSGGGGSVG